MLESDFNRRTECTECKSTIVSVLENMVTRPLYFLLTEAEESKSAPETVEFDKERIHLQTKGHYSHF